MTATKTTTIFCDTEGPYCIGWVGQVVGTAADSRRIARSRGWVRTDGRDICPPCQKRPTWPGTEDGGDER